MKRNLSLTLTGAASLSLLIGITAFAAPLTEEQAQKTVTPYLPSSSIFLYTEVDDGCYELKYSNESKQEGYQWKVNQDTGTLVSFESEAYDSRGGVKVNLPEEAAKKKVTDEIAGAEILSVKTDQDDDIEYEIRFKTDTCYGKYSIHPETGIVLEREIKFSIWKENTASSQQITRDKAIELAKKQVPDAVVTDVELDWEKSIYCYEIELYKDSIEYTVYINAATGDIVTSRQDKDDWHKSKSPQSSGTQQSSQDIGIEKAKQAALNLVPGGIIEKCEPDYDDGRFIYEVELKKDGWEYEIEIDGITGQVLKNERDSDD